MIDDVLQILGAQADVQRVQHRPHAGAGMVGLQMPGAVPHEGAHPVADVDARLAERVGQLMRPVAGLAVGLTAHPVLGCRHDLFIGRDLGASVEDVGHQQGSALHGH